MSRETIARWNAIPLVPETRLKRPRPDSDDSDDDVSLVSRSPSPDRMDVDSHNYDQYVPGFVEPEAITVETKIKPTNRGFAMLAKLGWQEGQPLGVSGDGRVDPIPFQVKRDATGVGKMSQDVRMIETTVSQRRELDSERMTKETEDQRKSREDSVARRSALESELSSTIKAFYCDLCEKQFKTVVAYTEHTNSYAHHHKARFKDMQANIRIPQDDLNKRKEKERKREEKELRKIAAANGIKMAKPSSATPALAPVDTSDIDGVPLSPGWAPPSGSRPAESQSGFKKSGWAAVGSSASESTHSSGALPVSSSARHPSFRTAGWTSLDTGSSQSLPAPPPPPPPTSYLPPPPTDVGVPPLPPAGGWSDISSSTTSRWGPIAPPASPPPPPTGSAPPPASVPPPSQTGAWSSLPDAPSRWSTVTAATPIPHAAVSQQPASKAQASRAGWQQFQKAASKRR